MGLLRRSSSPARAKESDAAPAAGAASTSEAAAPAASEAVADDTKKKSRFGRRSSTPTKAAAAGEEAAAAAAAADGTAAAPPAEEAKKRRGFLGRRPSAKPLEARSGADAADASDATNAGAATDTAASAAAYKDPAAATAVAAPSAAPAQAPAAPSPASVQSVTTKDASGGGAVGSGGGSGGDGLPSSSALPAAAPLPPPGPLPTTTAADDEGDAAPPTAPAASKKAVAKAAPPTTPLPDGTKVWVRRTNGTESIAFIQSFDAQKRTYRVELDARGSGKHKASRMTDIRPAEGDGASSSSTAPTPATATAAAAPAPAPAPAPSPPPPPKASAPAAAKPTPPPKTPPGPPTRKKSSLDPSKFFEGAGDAAGTLIWRVEHMAPVPVDRGAYGKFHTGDSYLVLRTVPTTSGGFEYDLYFWLGAETSVDEQGAAALLAVQLDDKLGGAPVQHRVVQGHEPHEFAVAVGGTIEYLAGGVEGGFTKVEAEVLPTRLLHVKGLKTCRVEQVGLSVGSLNGGDVFLLDDGSAVYLWSGREASVKEKQRGAEVAKGIKDERVHQVELLGEVVIHRLEQGQKSEDEHPEFWALLGGDKSMVRPAVADSAEDDAKGARESELFHLHESEDGKKALTIEKVKGGPLRAALDPTDTFVLVCPGEIYAWIGSKATDGERKHAMLKAQEFIMSRGMPVWTPVTRVVQGAEPTLFKAKFPDWASHSEGKIDVEKIQLIKGISSGINIARRLREDAPEEIAKKVMVATPTELRRRAAAREKEAPKVRRAEEGSLQVWRVANFRKVPLDEGSFGEFYAGDCYIVLFKYIEANKEEVTLYHWHGRLCSADERGSAALLVRTMDDDDYGGNARQERVVQNNEPEDFLALFAGRMVVRDGGLSKSGEDTRDLDGVSLFHVKGQSARTVRAVQVAEDASVLNSGDCFVLQRPGAVDVWHGSLASAEERATSLEVGEAVARRLAADAASGAGQNGGLAAEEVAKMALAKAASVVAIDADGDGVPDMAVPYVLALEPGASMPGGAHAEKLGTYLPEVGSTNGRPSYAHESNGALLMWWAKDKWWLGKRDEVGRNRGWLKVKDSGYSPPESGWIVYATKEKSWKEVADLKCRPSERIVLGGALPDGSPHGEKLGEFCRTADTVNGRPVYCREVRPNLMLWWSGGRWWLGKRDELGTNRGWIKAQTDCESPLDAPPDSWHVFSSTERKWLPAGGISCKANDEFVPTAEGAAAAKDDAAAAAPECASWAVASFAEGAEPPEFWSALGGKKPYQTLKDEKASGDDAHAPRLFHCSDQTGAFRVEEVLDFSQEDLEHDDVYILDCFTNVFVWVGANQPREREVRLAMETASKYISLQAALDGRPAEIKALEIRAGSEPLAFTKEFVGWSKANVEAWEDPYDKRLRLLREARQRELDEMVDTSCEPEQAEGDDEDEATAAGRPKGQKADARWEGGKEAPPTPSSIPVKNIVKLTAERNGGKAPPVIALANGEVHLRRAKQAAAAPSPRSFKWQVGTAATAAVGLRNETSLAKPAVEKLVLPSAASSSTPVIPVLPLGNLPKIHEASSLDSARRRAKAAALAAGGEASEYSDPQTARFDVEAIQSGDTPRLNPVCKELYLHDSDFLKIFGMDKDAFWKQPHWKQREAKKKAGLF